MVNFGELFEFHFFLLYDISMKKDLRVLVVVEGMMEAEIIKTKLDSLNIPCFLKFESAGRLFGITMNGLGEVKIMVPSEYYSEAKKNINPRQVKPEKKDQK